MNDIILSHCTNEEREAYRSSFAWGSTINMCRDGKPIQICLTETLFQISSKALKKKQNTNDIVLAHIYSKLTIIMLVA